MYCCGLSPSSKLRRVELIVGTVAAVLFLSPSTRAFSPAIDEILSKRSRVT